MKFSSKILKTSSLFVFFFLISCTNPDANKIELQYPAALLDVFNSDPGYYALYFSSREIDTDLTTNCGVASPATTATGATGATGTTTPATTTGTTSTTNTRFSILNQYIMKNSKETLNFKFIYDTNQIRGSIDQQLGFTITGGPYNATITGKQGTVTWGIGAVGYIDESLTASQNLTFMKGVEVTLNGTFTRGSTASTVTPFTCNTVDNVNCTSAVTTSQCFTTDNKTCLSTTTSTTGTPITINITLNCETKTIIY
jgi:hypothetical protein